MPCYDRPMILPRDWPLRSAVRWRVRPAEHPMAPDGGMPAKWPMGV
ncbi:MAG: hypothetical protein JWM95_1800, partial [Gemmatimonadetes bacterium]|nr:hypothetical protein [Gemmatimonadota bacterium]